MAYKIVRFFFNTKVRRTVKIVPTQALAEEWCSDPETSSSTCKGVVGKRRTRERGPWFDGWREC